jgi:hypothetical protein
MAEANPKVMEVVEAELKKDPDISNPELLEKAKKVDPAVAELTPRQFNATYPLQVKRAMKPRRRTQKKTSKATPRRGTKRAESGGDRDRVRTELLALAKDVANAQGKGDVVDVIAGIDRYVDRVIKAAS